MFRVLCASIGLLVANSSWAASFEAGDITLLVYEKGEPASGISVYVDGEISGITGDDGATDVEAGAGAHELLLERDGTDLASIAIQLGGGETAEVSVALRGLGREPGIRIQKYPADAVAPVSGQIQSQDGDPISGAVLLVSDIDVQATTGPDGSFSLEIPRGKYSVEVSADGFATRSFRGVRALSSVDSDLVLSLQSAAAGATTLGELGGGVDEVVVVAQYVPDTAVASEQDSLSVLDVVTAQEISIAGDSDAAAALQRVTGVTVQDDVIFVRGLGDRYSTTLMNGAELPSPDPTQRVIALDLFPTDLLGGIAVQKTYTPDLPGDFSGGAVRLETKPIPDEFEAGASVSIGANTRSTFLRTLSHQGGDTDIIGRDDGTRAIPAIALELTNGGQTPLLDLSPEQREQVAESLPNIYDVRVIDVAPPDFGADLSFGSVYTGFDFADIGFQVAALYDFDARFRREERAELRSEGATVGIFESDELQRAERKIEAGSIASVALVFNDNHSVNYNNLISRQSTKGTFYAQGDEVDSGREFRRVTLEWIEEQLISNLITGEHVFEAANGLTLNWQFVRSSALRDVLDRREYTYSRRSGTDNPFVLAFDPGTGGIAPTRTWEFLDESANDHGVDLTMPFSLGSEITGEAKFGLRSTERDRTFDLIRWRFSAPTVRTEEFSALAELPSLELILRPDTIGPNNSTGAGWDFRNAQSLAIGGGNADSYEAIHDIDALYLMGDAYIGDWLRVQAGFRTEDSTINVSNSALGGGAASLANIESNDTLPSLNVTWFINPASQLRFGYSQTVNRPQFRELSPVEFRDPVTRRLTRGNAGLQQADITNFDIRYEYYWSGNEGFTAALFYKDFQNPIEITIGAGGETGFRSFINISQAEDFGAEFDFRWQFDELEDVATFLGDTYINMNLSLIDSEVSLSQDELGVLTNPERRLQGQSPWIVNTTLGYSNPVWQTDIALLFNVSGERIAEVGANGLPDAEEQPAPQLDFNLRQRFFQNWKFNFKVRNLLDSEIEIRQGNQIQRRYRRGTTASVSVGYDF